MEILNFSDNGNPKTKKSSKRRAFIGIGVIAAAVGLSSTLAANISINAGPVEFGQGVAQTVACSGDESVIVTPATSFTNAPSSVTREATFYGADTLTVTSSENLSVGMLIQPAEVDTVITEINGNELRISRPGAAEGTVLTLTFTPSSGTEQTVTSVLDSGNEGDYEVGTSSMGVETLGLEAGMLVSGPGIPTNTVVVLADQADGTYLELSKDTDYTSGELTFRNSGQSAFKLSDIIVSNIPDTCNGKVFTIKLYDNESPEPLKISNFGDGDTSVQVWWGNGYEMVGQGATEPNDAIVRYPADDEVWGSWHVTSHYDGPAIETADTPDSMMADGAFKIILPTAVDASKVYKITVESQDDSDSFNVGNLGRSFFEWWL